MAPPEGPDPESLCVPPFNRLDKKDGETGRNTEKVTVSWLVGYACMELL